MFRSAGTIGFHLSLFSLPTFRSSGTMGTPKSEYYPILYHLAKCYLDSTKWDCCLLVPAEQKMGRKEIQNIVNRSEGTKGGEYFVRYFMYAK